jgi:uncharacterized membrane protein
VVVLLSKGTRWHRTWGHAYVMSMAGVVATALGIYDLTSSFGPFHFGALVAGLTTVSGMVSVLFRRPRGAWLPAHATWMSGSYIGLLCAFCAESLTRFVLPALAPYMEGSVRTLFWILVAVGSLAVAVVGARIVKVRLPRAIASTPVAMRAERQFLRAIDDASPESATLPR